MKMVKNFNETPVQEIWVNEGDQIMAFMRGDLIYVFNFSPTRSYTDYGFLVPTGSYNVVLNTDSKEFGGNGFADDSVTHLTNYDELYVKVVFPRCSMRLLDSCLRKEGVVKTLYSSTFSSSVKEKLKFLQQQIKFAVE